MVTNYCQPSPNIRLYSIAVSREMLLPPQTTITTRLSEFKSGTNCFNLDCRPASPEEAEEVIKCRRSSRSDSFSTEDRSSPYPSSRDDPLFLFLFLRLTGEELLVVVVDLAFPASPTAASMQTPHANSTSMRSSSTRRRTPRAASASDRTALCTASPRGGETAY